MNCGKEFKNATKTILRVLLCLLHLLRIFRATGETSFQSLASLSKSNRLVLTITLIMLSPSIHAVELSGDGAEHGVSGTFSIVAVDPDTRVCGAAVASKYPGVGKVVAYARADVGAFCTQHHHVPAWGERALDLLAAGDLPEEVLGNLLKDDMRHHKRQLAIIDMRGCAANRNPAGADPSGVYWGAMSGQYYACQGNTLVGRQVIVAMAQAYEETKGSLADRLLAALVAADCVGGDHRGRQAAGIRVAKRGVEGYWLELQIEDHPDAVMELLKEYVQSNHDAKGQWPVGQLPFAHPCVKPPTPK